MKKIITLIMDFQCKRSLMKATALLIGYNGIGQYEIETGSRRLYVKVLLVGVSEHGKRRDTEEKKGYQ